MARFVVASGVVVETPAGVSASARAPELARRRGGRGPGEADDTHTALIEALGEASFEVAAIIDFDNGPPAARRLRGPGQANQISVDVAPGQSAVVLVEGEGGVFAWSLAKEPPAAGGGRRALNRTLTFDLGGEPAPEDADDTRRAGPARRGSALSWLIGKVTEPIAAYVLKFVAAGIIDFAVDRIEGDMPLGLVNLADNRPEAWKPGATPLPRLPQDRPVRILLMVHGTFSDTTGSFGQLTLTEEGRDFLQRARQSYDAVLGFDHKTLAEDTPANAKAFARALSGLGLPQGSVIDAVAYSRGGLVYRGLAEGILARERPDLTLGKAVFVGCTNGGTNLAEPEHWAKMLDLYTNAAMAAARVITLLSGGGVALNPMVSTAIRLLGRFVQSFSEVAITDMRVPGLASMEPDGTVVTTLNGASDNLGRLALYHAVTSNFVARFEPKKGVTKELEQALLDKVTNRLFGGANDLVVDTASMTTLGERQARLDPGKVFAFGDVEDVYHTVYFSTVEVATCLLDWLDLRPQPKMAEPPTAPPPVPSPAPRRVTRGTRGGPPPGVDILEFKVHVPASLDSDGGGLAYESNEEDDIPAAGDGAGTGSSGGEGRSSARRSGGSPAPQAPPPDAPAPEATVPCYFAAEMDRAPDLGRPASVFVTVSREQIDAAIHAAAAVLDTPVAVKAETDLDIEIIALSNCKVVGPAKQSFPPPPAGDPEVRRFQVQGFEAGKAEVLVEARQAGQVLASFTLAPVFTDPSGERLRASAVASPAPAGDDQPTVLRIYETWQPNSTLVLRYDLDSSDPAIAVFDEVSLGANTSRDDYVASILQEMENAWANSDGAYKRTLLNLTSSATTRADNLLPKPIREALWKHRDKIKAIQVISEEPMIPWELMCITDPTGQSGEEGRFLSEWGLVRWLQNVPRPSRRIRIAGDKVYYVIPEYLDKGYRLPEALRERDMLKAMFPGATEVEADSLEVANFLNKKACEADVLHFACHGEAQQGSVLRAQLLMAGQQRDDGRIDPDIVNMDVVRTRFSCSGEEPRPLVFINACQTGKGGRGLRGVSGFADAFLRPRSGRGAGVFVGALWSVNDSLALTFSETFYAELKKGKMLVDAVRAAREACKTNQELTWLAYSVFGNPFARLQD